MLLCSCLRCPLAAGDLLCISSSPSRRCCGCRKVGCHGLRWALMGQCTGCRRAALWQPFGCVGSALWLQAICPVAAGALLCGIDQLIWCMCCINGFAASSARIAAHECMAALASSQCAVSHQCDRLPLTCAAGAKGRCRCSCGFGPASGCGSECSAMPRVCSAQQCGRGLPSEGPHWQACLDWC